MNDLENRAVTADDDLTLATERDEDAERNAKVLDEVVTKWRMTINWGKTKAIVVKRRGHL